MPPKDAPEVEVRTRDELRAWLAAHHGGAGVWLVTGRKASEHYLPYAEVVRECLAWGWVDSLPRAKDDLRTMLWISPRRPGSNWSRVNKDHVAALEALGLMAPPARAAVERARADGTWDALDRVEGGEVPDDLAAALEAAGARAAWDAFPRSVRRGALEIVLNAKRAGTRAAKVAAIVQAAARGERPFQWRGR
jgi:uncharacterized protein YdeI (YjbR/CyaY-like superfamily)